MERSVPIGNLDNVLLAWDINGKPISLAHGGPLRMIVPGYTGVNNIKYVKTVALTAVETDAKIQLTNYRIHGLGEKSAPSQPSVWEMPVKSWVTSPLLDRKAGRIQIAGFALGGMNAVAGVDVSVDGGESWGKADFVGPDLGRFAWRQFVLSTELKPGSYTLVSRATDVLGNVQPRDLEPNGSGYNHNGWLAPGVKIAVG